MEGVVQEGKETVLLDRVEDPEISHELRTVGVAHVAELADHHVRHPGGVDDLPASELDQLSQVGPLHPALGADVDRAGI